MAKNTIGHYYLLHTGLGQKELKASEAQKFYKSLIKAERSFRSMKSSLDVRPIRHRKAGRIQAYICFNYLSLWIIRYIEKQWREREIKCEVPDKLKEWD